MGSDIAENKGLLKDGVGEKELGRLALMIKKLEAMSMAMVRFDGSAAALSALLRRVDFSFTTSITSEDEVTEEGAEEDGEDDLRAEEGG